MNLYLRKDGRYESRIPNGKKSDGKRSFIYVLARTKEKCIERVQKVRRKMTPGRSCKLTFNSSVEITLIRYVHSSFEQKREYMKRVQMNF